jgi:hypothetical protein
MTDTWLQIFSMNNFINKKFYDSTEENGKKSFSCNLFEYKKIPIILRFVINLKPSFKCIRENLSLTLFINSCHIFMMKIYFISTNFLKYDLIRNMRPLKKWHIMLSINLFIFYRKMSNLWSNKSPCSPWGMIMNFKNVQAESIELNYVEDWAYL